MKEDIIKEKSFNFAVKTVDLCRELRKEHKEYLLSDHLMRCGTLIGAKVREAKNAAGKGGFVDNMIAAQKACDQTLYWLALLQEGGHLSQETYQSMEEKAITLLKITSSIIITSTKKKEEAQAA